MIFSTENLPNNVEFSLQSDLPEFQLRKLIPKSDNFSFFEVLTPNFTKLNYDRPQGSEETYLRDLFEWIGGLNLRLDSYLGVRGDVKEDESFVSSFTPDTTLFDQTLPMQSTSYSGLISPSYVEVHILLLYV